jgi:hypothetical protein
MGYIWQGQHKGLGTWRGYVDGQEIPADVAEKDQRFDEWVKSGVLVDSEKLKAEAEAREAILKKVEENKAKAAEAEQDAQPQPKKKKKKSKGGKK